MNNGKWITAGALAISSNCAFEATADALKFPLQCNVHPTACSALIRGASDPAKCPDVWQKARGGRVYFQQGNAGKAIVNVLGNRFPGTVVQCNDIKCTMVLENAYDTFHIAIDRVKGGIDLVRTHDARGINGWLAISNFFEGTCEGE